jgi:hypothetical protein
MVLVVRDVTSKGNGNRNAILAPTRAARALNVVARFRGDVPQKDGFEAAHVYAHLESGRTAKDIDFSSDKCFLIFASDGIGELGGMLLDLKRKWAEEKTIAIVVPRKAFLKSGVIEHLRNAGTLWRLADAEPIESV